MTLQGFLEAMSEREKKITVFSPDRYETVDDYFETRNVTVEHEAIPDDDSGGFVVVSKDGTFLGSVGAAAIRELVSPTIADPGENRPVALRGLLDLLADTPFVSFDERQMLMVAREIEDRAYRRGRGTLRTGFTSLSVMKAQVDVYEALAAQGLDVHVYGEPDWTPTVPGVTVHGETTPEIGSFWFVVFDGGGDDRQACALLAERLADDPASFRGFWTYDPELVADFDGYLAETYG